MGLYLNTMFVVLDESLHANCYRDRSSENYFTNGCYSFSEKKNNNSLNINAVLLHFLLDHWEPNQKLLICPGDVCLSGFNSYAYKTHASMRTHRNADWKLWRGNRSAARSREGTPMGLIKEMEQTAEIIGEHKSFSNPVSLSLFYARCNESNKITSHKTQCCFHTEIRDV